MEQLSSSTENQSETIVQAIHSLETKYPDQVRTIQALGSFIAEFFQTDPSQELPAEIAE